MKDLPEVHGVGAAMPRPEGPAKVRGEFVFATDLHRPDMLWGATLRSPHPFARILSIDLDPAKAMPGVHAVLGPWDVPDNRYGVIVRDTPVLAEEYVRYVGEPIAIVAADDLVTARRAAAAIVVKYEVLSPLTDPDKALESGHIHRHLDFRMGDPTVVGEVIAEGEYSTPRQDHSFLAPDAGLACVLPDGAGVEIIGATQWVHNDREQIAPALGLPEEMVFVRNAGVGGAFGGRFVISWQIHGALLALHTGRPVKFLYTREETFVARYHRRPMRFWVRHHARRDGTLVNLEVRMIAEDGPYLNTSGPAIGSSSALVQGPYRIPNAHIQGWSVSTNNGMTGSMRGFGVVEAIFACESNLDKLAATLGMDGVELRRLNAMQQGDDWIVGQVQDAPAPVQELLALCEAMPLPDEPDPSQIPAIHLPGGIGTPTRPGDVQRSVGVALAAKGVCLSEGAPVNATALVSLQDGVARVDIAAADVGQGFATIALQIAQTCLGVSRISLGPCDSRLPRAATTDGQQQSMTSGAAIAKAATRVKERLLRLYARKKGLDPDDLDVCDDHIVSADGTVLDSVQDGGFGLVFRATERFDQRRTRPIDEPASGGPVMVGFNFSAGRCVIDIDRELGLVKVVQLDIAQDVGRLLNPMQAHGQIAGGALMGVGLALMEELQIREGHYCNANWRTYLVPTMADAPAVHTRFLENAEPGIPLGIRGIAELPHVQGPVAVLAALRKATGFALPSMPITPERLANLGLEQHNQVVRESITGSPSGPWRVTSREPKSGPWAKQRP
ncbi:MAG: molybdopterin cofactor-binding domain-containing protein [Synechococcus sp.]|nr:molybdopterin cofactor-binding domain-containing protein [Synechococcus sp.]